MVNETSVEEEFRRMGEETGKVIYVITVDSMGEKGFYAKLDSVYPYDCLGLVTGQYDDGVFEGYLGQLQPFIGAVAGIKSVETRDKEIIYFNGDLKFEKPFYDIFTNLGDNEFINEMRRNKFGEGHGYELDEKMVSYLKKEDSKKKEIYSLRIHELIKANSEWLEEFPELVIEPNE
ncbi:MAG: hypothetical protein KAT28_03685 [Candidatus Aenigmarchaeota archaeon]|nr:hypothetical protein [Candidatus Aenigmarchaeota archaeon]